MGILDNLSAQDVEHMFMDDDNIIDGLDIVNIDIDGISDEAANKVKILIEDLTKFYYDEEFLKANPNFRRRVDNDIESLRLLLKMRAADEVTHDVLIKAIAANSGNASLYRSLTQVQTTILQITTKIENIIANLTTMIKGYQLELNFKLEQEQLNNDTTDNNNEADIPTAHRGSKSFIEQMNKIEQQDLFENDIDNEEEEND
jgi:hypothetical protein